MCPQVRTLASKSTSLKQMVDIYVRNDYVGFTYGYNVKSLNNNSYRIIA